MIERIVTIEPAYDKTHDDPKKNYGIHGCNMRFVLKGNKGAYQFLIFTNWHLPEVTQRLGSRLYEPIGGDHHWMERPMAADVGYHALEPQYEDQSTMGPCEYLDGRLCYYDGSGVHAETVFEMMLRGGSEAVWKELERLYKVRFGEEEQQDD